MSSADCQLDFFKTHPQGNTFFEKKYYGVAKMVFGNRVVVFHTLSAIGESAKLCFLLFLCYNGTENRACR